MDKMSKQQKRHLKKLMIGAWIIVANLSLFYIHATDLSTLYPKGNKSAEDKIHLIHADNLEYDQFTNPDAQRLSGDVEFLHKDLRMFCDSAVLFLSTNSFEAFGSIKIEQGDTVSLLGEYLYYDGNTQIAEVRYNVEMRHRESLLLTDSLNFDRLESKGYFFEGGTLIDGENVLTSDWGEYYTSTRKSSFNYNVILESPQYRLISDTLNYDLQTKWADVSGPSEIRSGKSIIKTQK